MPFIDYQPFIGAHYNCEEANTAGLADEVAAHTLAIQDSPVGSLAGKLNLGRGPCDGVFGAGGKGFAGSAVGSGAWDTRKTTISKFSFMAWCRLQDGHGATQELASQARSAANDNTKAWVLRGVQDFGGGDEGPVFLGHDASDFALSTGFNWIIPSPHNEWYFLGWSMDFTVSGNGRFVGYIRVPSIGESHVVTDPVPDNMWSHSQLDVVMIGIGSGHSTGGDSFDVDHITLLTEYAIADVAEFALFSQAPLIYPGGFDLSGSDPGAAPDSARYHYFDKRNRR
jgi:hypothetical protein